MAHFTCSETQIKYTPNGVQTSWPFPFEYMAKTDIWVGFWNENTREWDQVPIGLMSMCNLLLVSLSR